MSNKLIYGTNAIYVKDAKAACDSVLPVLKRIFEGWGLQMGGVMVASGNDNAELDKYRALLSKSNSELKATQARLELVQNELKHCHNDIWWYKQRIRALEEKCQQVYLEK